MRFRSAEPVLLLALLSLAAVKANAAKLLDLDPLPVDHHTYYFDREKVSAVYMTHVYGIGPAPIPIGEDGKKFLDGLNLTRKFITLTSTLGPLYIKATAVQLIADAVPAQRSDPKVQTFIYPGPPGGVTPRAWQVFETPKQVREKVDEFREKEESHE